MNKKYVCIYVGHCGYPEWSKGRVLSNSLPPLYLKTIAIAEGSIIELILSSNTTKTMYLQERDITVTTNTNWFNKHFILKPINYNKYWAELCDEQEA